MVSAQERLTKLNLFCTVQLKLPFCLVPGTITGLPKNVSLISGSTLNLTCDVIGDPAPSIYWEKKPSSDVGGAELRNRNATLFIRNVRVEDEGTYKCVVKNRAGNDSSATMVQVKGLY